MDRTAKQTAPASRASLWRHRDFMFLWGGQTASEVGAAVTQLALPLVAVLLLDATTLQVGILAAVTTLPHLLVSLHAGAIVDRMAKRKLMLWCDLGRMVLLGSIPLATVSLLGLHLTYPHLLVVGLLSGVLSVFFSIAYQSYLPVLLTKEELIDGNGKIGTTAAIAGFAGPPIGGALIGLLGAARAIAIDALSYGISAISLLFIRVPEPKPEPRVEGSKMRHEIAEGLGFVFRHPVLRNIAASSAMSNFFSAMFTALSMVYLIRVLHVQPGYIGLLWSVAAVGGMLGGLLVGRLTKRVGTARIIWMAPLILGFPMFLQPFAQPGWGVALYSAGWFFYSLYAVIFNVAQVSYRQAVTPLALLGRVSASMRFLVWGLIPLGSALGGVLGSQLGVRETIWIGVAGTWLSGLWVYFSPLRTMRDAEDAVFPAKGNQTAAVEADSTT